MKKIIIFLAVLALASCNKALNDIQQPDVNTDTRIQANEIWYTSADPKPLEVNDAQICNAALVGNRYDGDHGTLIFDGPVTSICDNAFRGCANLESVTLPPVVREVGKNAFKGCTGMKFINIDSEDMVPVADDNSFETGALTFIRVPYKKFFQYKDQWKAASKNLMVGKGYEDIDRSRWTEYLPESMPLGLLTVPAAHDAATYFASFGTDLTHWLKDQAYDYATMWDHGARMFDLRLGYNGKGDEFYEGCYFYHGDSKKATWINCQMNRYDDDISLHFPDRTSLDNSFMILEAQAECFWEADNDKKINAFEVLMRNLIEKYGAERFISYNPSLTLGELKGKIMMFVTSSEFTANYEHIGHVKQVPINFRGDGWIECYVDGKTTGKSYSIMFENHWEVYDADEKTNWVIKALKTITPDLLVLNLNATTTYVLQYGQSWPISSVLNRKMVDFLTNDASWAAFRRPLGLVYMDFIGKENFDDYDFAGESLAKQLVLHNFKDYIFK